MPLSSFSNPSLPTPTSPMATATKSPASGDLLCASLSLMHVCIGLEELAGHHPSVPFLTLRAPLSLLQDLAAVRAAMTVGSSHSQ
uniref:Uncharacterized protein n=1 Tax=Arundo donax TaxID=35708 RepID=A0A0A8YTN9_ARUDO